MNGKKNQKKILRALLWTAAVVMCLAVAVPQLAGAFGDFDSRSDYGGSGRSSSSSDSSDFDLFELLHLVTMVGRIFGIDSPIVSIVIVVVIVVVFKVISAALKGNAPQEGLKQSAPSRPDTLRQLREEDPAFDAENLADRVRDLFTRMQEGWENGDIDSLHGDFMPDTWTRFNTQLQNKIAAGETTHVRDIFFDHVDLLSYATDQEHQILKVKLTVTHNVWTTNAAGKCIQGTEKTRKRFEFLWTMTRPLGAVTGGSALQDTEHCPNCGAELDLEAFAECPFCHTPIMKVAPDWVISEIDALSQTTLHD